MEKCINTFLIYFSLFLIIFFILFDSTTPSISSGSSSLDPYIKEEVPLPQAPNVPEKNLKTKTIENEQVLRYFGHISMPKEVRGIYITAWTAGSAKRVGEILSLFDNSVLNTIVIDIKDSTGKLSYQPQNQQLLSLGVGSNKISNLPELIKKFHDKGIYIVGRLAVFQDPFYASLYPEYTVKDNRDDSTWKDYKGISWLNPQNMEVADYVLKIAEDAYGQGFDEINFDYVRFPSDGQLRYMNLSDLSKNKAQTMEDFFKYINGDLSSKGIPFSVDIFGLTMSSKDDLGIGQNLELIAPHAPIISPMLYPSHFGNGSYGLAIPAKEPYKVIERSLSDGIARMDTLGIDKERIRPWFQDFDLVGVPYTPQLVKAQIEAASDAGINSWLLWDPANRYTEEVFRN